MSQWLGSGFVASLARFGGRPALSVAGEELSYAALAGRAGALAQALGELIAAGPALTAVLAARSVPAYAGILAALFRGTAMSRSTPGDPAAQLSDVLAHSGCRSLIVDARGEAVLDALLADAEAPLRVVLADPVGCRGHRPPPPEARHSPGLTGPCPLPPVPAVAPDAPAYLLYTSGSTGRPKGGGSVTRQRRAFPWRDGRPVHPVGERSLFADVRPDVRPVGVRPVHGLAGRRLRLLPGRRRTTPPAEFYRRAGITVWPPAPSVAVLLNRLRQLEPGAFPRLRYSLFCGEPLPAAAAVAWAAAAPNSVVENLYGPTELTLACMAWRLPVFAQASGTAPIGAPLAGLVARVVTPELTDVAPGEAGELLVWGRRWRWATGTTRKRPQPPSCAIRRPARAPTARATWRRGRRPRTAPSCFLAASTTRSSCMAIASSWGNRGRPGEPAGAAQVVVVGWPMTADGPSGPGRLPARGQRRCGAGIAVCARPASGVYDPEIAALS